MTPDIHRLRALRADLACLGAGTLCTVTERRLAVYALADPDDPPDDEEGCEPAAVGPRTLAFGGKDMIHLVDRATESIASVAGRWLAAAPDGARVLVERYGELAILEP